MNCAHRTAIVLKMALATLSVSIGSGCVSMSPAERQEWSRLEQQRVEPTQHKNPGLAGALNILPGVGNFYLAAGTEETAHIGTGIANILLWPLSISWGIPEAIIDANTYNEKMTARASLRGSLPEGRKEDD